MPRSTHIVYVLILATFAAVLAGCGGSSGGGNSQPEIVGEETIVMGDATAIPPTETATPIRDLPPTWTPVPSLTPVPPRPTVAISPRPTYELYAPPTWTPGPGEPIGEGPAVPSGPTPSPSPTPFRSDLAVITSGNAAQITEIGSLEDAAVTDLAWSPDGLALAVTRNDGIYVFTHADFERMPLMILNDAPASDTSVGFTVEAVAFSPNGQFIAHTNSEGKLIVWEAATQSEIFEFSASESTLWDVAFNPASTQIVASDDQGFLHVWDIAARQEVSKIDTGGESVRDIAVYPPSDFVIVASASNNRAKVWNLTTGAELAEVTGHTDGVRAVAFDPTGDTFATGGNEGSVRIWTVLGARNQSPEAALNGHDGSITSIAYSGDSTLMAVGVNSGMLHIWDLRANEELMRVQAHDSWVNAIVWSPDGTMLFTTGQDDTVRAWGVPNTPETD